MAQLRMVPHRHGFYVQVLCKGWFLIRWRYIRGFYEGGDRSKISFNEKTKAEKFVEKCLHLSPEVLNYWDSTCAGLYVGNLSLERALRFEPEGNLGLS